MDHYNFFIIFQKCVKQQGNRSEIYLKKKKSKKREHGRTRYHNMSEEKKQKLKEYQKKLSWS